MSTDQKASAWVEIDRSALRRNFEQLHEVAGPGSGVVAVVKTNAYGLGFPEVVRTLEELEPWGYGIGNVSEGRALRDLGVHRPALVLCPMLPTDVEAAVSLSLRPSVSSIEELRRIEVAAEALDRDVSVHVEVDTGMGRAGFSAERVASWGPEVVALTRGRVRWEGIFTHFHSAHEPDTNTVDEQARCFRQVVDRLRDRSDQPWLEHLCNSAGLLRHPELAADLVRPGIFLYGGSAGRDLPPPKPVIAVRGRVVLIRDAKPGTPVGYGATYRAVRPERWATVAIGYGDGLPRGLENRGAALIRGRRVPIVGRISMGMTVVDITDLDGGIEPEVGEVVTFVGADQGEEISLEEVGSHVGRSAYELLTGLPPHLPRVWL